MNNTTQKTPMKFSERFRLGKRSGGEREGFKWSRKKTVISATAAALALTMVVTMLPNTSLRSFAEGAGVISSVNGASSIPDEYQAVNVPASSISGYNFTDNGSNGLVAFDFHIFANEFASNAHTCGNVAVDDFGGTVLGESGAPEIGSREEHDTTSAKMSYVNYPENWTLVHNDLVLGNGNSFKGNQGAINPNGNNGQIQLVNKDGKKFLFGNDNAGFFNNKYIDDSTPMINIQDELDDAERYQGYLFDLMEDVKENGTQQKDPGPMGRTKGIVKDNVRVLSNDELFDGPAFGPGAFGMGFGPGGKKIDLKKYPEDTIIIDFHPGSQWTFFGPQAYHEAINFLSGSVELKGTTGKRVIINIDTDGWDKNMDFFDTHMKADNLTNEEDSVHKDNNILWNFYDSGKKQSFDKKIEIGGTWIGTILAPDADVKCRAGLNGSIIANRVATTAETHKSDYTGEKSIKDNTSITVTKKWVNDNADSRPLFITVKLYQNNKVYKTVEIDASNASSTNSNVWTYTFSDLPVSDPTGKNYRYKVDEVVPAGYKSQVSNYTIINTGEGGTPSETGDLYVRKTAEDGSTILPGARFRLTSDEGNNLSKVTGTNVESLTAGDSEVTWTSTGYNGKLSGLPYGNYTITEIGAPAGYKRSNEALKVQVPGTDNNNPKVFKDAPLSAKFLKRESVNYAPLAGAAFELTPNWGSSLKGVTVSGAENVTLATDSSNKITFTSGNGEITFNKIPAGSYTITETAAPAGYDKAVPVTFIVGEDGSVMKEDYSAWSGGTVTMDDDEHIEKEPEYGVLSFTKTDGSSNLYGATFRLTNVAGDKLDGTEGNRTATVADAENVTVSGDSITFTTKNKAVRISDLLAGNYTLTETAAPAGYKPASPVNFAITAANTADAPYALTIADEAIQLKVSKKDMTSSEPLPGAGLKLTQIKDANGNTLNPTVVKETWQSTSGVKTISPIAAGTYKLEETSVPAGYNKADDITITIDAYGNVTGTNVSGDTVTMYDKPASITIKKIIDNSNPVKNLAGAKLQLKSTDTPAKDLTNVTGVLEPKHPSTDTITWNSAGFPQELRMLPDGNYKLTEVEAPEGFDKADDITFTVSGGKITKIGDDTVDVTELSMADKRVTYHDIDFSKITFQYVKDATTGEDTPEIVKDSETKKNVVVDTPIAGAKFGIFDKRSKSFSESEAVHILNTTAGNDQATLRLCDGDYVLVELEAPEGYVKTDQKISFSIVNGQMTNVSLSTDEKATASYGNPKDKGLSLDGDCYYTLDATGIFERRGDYPAGVEFFLDPAYECTKFTLYKDDYNTKTELKSVSITTKPNNSAENNGKDKYYVDLGDLGNYDANYTYYAVLEIKKDGQTADASEVGDVPLNFVYKAASGETKDYNTSNGSADLSGFTPYESDTIPTLTIKLKPDTTEGKNPRFDAFHIYFDVPGEGNTSQPSYYKAKGHWSKTVITYLNPDDIPFIDGYYVIELDPSKTSDIYNDYGISFDVGSQPVNVFDGIYITTFVANDVTEAKVILNGGGGNQVERTVVSVDDIKDNLIPGDSTHNPTFRLPNGKKFVVDDKAVELTKVKEGAASTVLPGAEFILLDSDRNVVDNIYRKTTHKTETRPVLDEYGNEVWVGGVKQTEEVELPEKVYIYKRFAAGETIPSGFESVNVRNVDAETGEVTYNALVTDDYGKIKVEGLPEGTFTFTEIEAPSGYEMNDNTDTAFVLNTDHTEDSPKQLTVSNKAKTGTLDIIKYDEDRNPKAGAVFDLYSMSLEGGTPTLERTGLTTDHTGKVTVTGLDLNRLYFARETQAAPGTVIPDALIAKECKVEGYTGPIYSKELPRLNQTEVDGHEYRDSFYNISNGSYTAATPTEVNGRKYLSETEAEGGLHYGIILAEQSDKLFVINTDQADAQANGHYINVDPDITGTIAVFDDSTTTTFKKTDGTDLLAGAKIKIESTSSASAVSKFSGVRSSTAADVEHVFYAVKDGVNYPLIPDDKAADGSWKRADGQSLEGCTFVEYMTWTSTDGTTVTVDPDTGEETVNPAPAGFNGDVFSGLIAGSYRITEIGTPDGYTGVDSFTITVPVTAPIEIENTPKTTKLSLTASKLLEGASLTDGQFSFTLTGDRLDKVNGEAVTSRTANNDADGNIAFNDIATFSTKDVGERFVYTIVENAGSASGIGYDSRSYQVTVEVQMIDGEPAARIVGLQYTDGDDTYACSKIKFENTYTAAPATLAPTVTKTLNGKSADAEAFSFQLLDSEGNVLETVKSPALTNGTAAPVTFTALSFDAVGEYTYTIKEVEPETGKLGGVAYDSTVYTWTVNVTDPGTGTLSAEGSYSGGAATDKAAFTNTYSAAGVTDQFAVNKTFSGRDTVEGDVFTFNLHETSPDTVTADRLAADQTVTVNGSGDALFPIISYTVPGTHTYEITEVEPDENKIPGVTYDGTVYTMTVEVTDGGAGTLVATKTLTKTVTDDDQTVTTTIENGVAAFENTYRAGEISEHFTVSKTFTGRTPNDNDVFTFRLRETTEAEVANKLNEDKTVTVTGSGSASFADITYTATGTHTYEITEVEPDEKIPGVTYDKTVYTMTVEVTDDGAGSLVAAKTLTKPVTNDGGETVAQTVDGGIAAFNNEYTAQGTEALISVSKSYNGSSTDTFTFKLHETTAEDISDKIEDRTVTVNGSGTVAFDAISYIAPGTHTYTVTEVIPDERIIGMLYDETVYTWTVVVADNGTGNLTVTKTLNNGTEDVNGDTAEFTNTYKALNISKKAVGAGEELDGAQLTLTYLAPIGTLENVGSKLNAQKSDDNKSISWTSSNANGENILYGLPSGNYELKEETAPNGYLVAESIYFKALPDGTYKELTKVVTDNGDGTETVTYEEGDVISDKRITMRDDYDRTATISKKAVNGTGELAGALLTVTLKKADEDVDADATLEGIKAKYTDGTDAALTTDTENHMYVQWTSGDKAVVLSQLPAGLYELKEETAPEGYLVAESIYFKVDLDGTISQTNESGTEASGIDVNGKTIIMLDAHDRTATISKQAANGTGELEGALLTVTLVEADENVDAEATLAEVTAKDSDGETVSLTRNSGNTYVRWTSGTKEVTLSKLPAGLYELKEETAPDGYLVAESIYFKVDDNGAVTQTDENGEALDDGTAVDGKKVTMLDAPRTATISKKAVNGTGELEGALLTVTLVAADETVNKDADLENVTAKYTDGSDVEYTKADDNTYVQWTSGAKEVTLSKLPAGVYELKEETAPDGYLVAEKIYFKVDKNGNVTQTGATGEDLENGTAVDGKTVTMLDAPRTATISKKAVNGTGELEGAVLTVTLVKADETVNKDADLANVTAKYTDDSDVEYTKAEDNTYVQWTSGTKEVTLSKLPAGVYELKEETAPDGYIVAEKIYFKVDKDGKVTQTGSTGEALASGTAVSGKTVTMLDAPRTATISKKAVGAGEELPGAVLTVTAMSENGTLSGVNSKLTAKKSDDNKSITWTSGNTPNELSKLPAGYYELKEETAPNGYVVAEKIYFAVSENGVITQTDDKGEALTGGTAVSGKNVTMLDAPRTATISKQEVGGGDELPGAVLTVTAMSEGVTLEGVTSKLNSKTSDDKKSVTWTSGKTANELSKLPEGYYELKEETAPNGYTVAETMYFKVESDGKIKSATKTSTGFTDGNAVDKKTVVMYDAPKRGAVISKQATGAGDELPGAVLTVTAKSEGVTLEGTTSKLNAKLSDDKKSVTWTSGNEANELSMLPEGIYELKEETAPDGFAVAEIIYFKVESDGTIKSCTKAEYDKGAKAEWKTPEDGKVIMKDAPTAATISKQEVGGGSELPGARVTVKLETPDKTGATLEGVTSTFGDKATVSDDKLSITWTSEADKKNTLSKLPTGVYSLTEVTSPDGYDVAETIYFKVEKDGTIKSCTKTEYSKGANAAWTTVSDKTVIMKDAPLNAVISKQAVGAGDELPGAKLTVKLVSPAKTGATLENVTSSFGNKATMSDDKLSITWTSEANKKNTLTKLPAGIYSLTEIQAPDGYDIAEVIYFNVKSDGTVECCTETEYKKGTSATWTKADNDTVIMKDALKSNGTTYDFSFTKKDTFDAALAGATFDLRGTGYNQTAVSDANGKVSFNGLQAGQTYTLTETKAPDGYDKSGSSITVTVDANGNKAYKDFNSTLTLAQVEKAVHNNKTPVDVAGSTDYKVGDTVDLMSQLLKFRPDAAGRQITWRTSDGQVVSVDENGKAIVNGLGRAEISAYYGDDKLATFVLGASEETSVIIGDNEVPNTRDLIIKYIKIAAIALIISTMVALGCVHLYRRRKAARSAR